MVCVGQGSMRAGSKQSMPAAKKELSQRTDFLRPRLPEVSSTDIALTDLLLRHACSRNPRTLQLQCCGGSLTTGALRAFRRCAVEAPPRLGEKSPSKGKLSECNLCTPHLRQGQLRGFRGLPGISLATKGKLLGLRGFRPSECSCSNRRCGIARGPLQQ